MSATFRGPQSASRPHPSPPPVCCPVALTASGLRARRHFWLLCWWHAALRPLGEILVRGRAAPDPLAAKISRFVEASSGSGRVGCRAGRSGGRRSIATQLRRFRHWRVSSVLTGCEHSQETTCLSEYNHLLFFSILSLALLSLSYYETVFRFKMPSEFFFD